MGRDPPKSRTWLFFAFFAVIFYTAYNYMIGLLGHDVVGGKIVNSMTLGVGALVIHIY